MTCRAPDHLAFLFDGLSRLPAPRSIAELGLDASGEAALSAWATRAGSAHLRNDPAGFGLAFLACATLVAREKLGDHQLWPHVFEWFRGKPAATLFAGQQPGIDLKSAIECAARRFELRHGFGRGDDEHRWYLTVLLQCGLTRPALARLPDWLAGAPTWRAVDLLLHDTELRSESFRAMFEHLRAIRLGWETDLPPSPWLAGELRDAARLAARARLSLGTAAATGDTPSIRIAAGHGAELRFRIPL
ncbi:MAG: hypothetical protein R3B13_41600, partial [Polyangiaceae bacterium]